MSAQRAFLRSLPSPLESAPGAANNFPQPPVMAENGQQFAAQPGEHTGIFRTDSPDEAGISFQADCAGGDLPAAELLGEESGDLDELVRAALRRTGRGRPAAFDEHAKGKLVALLALGLSLRQAASVLGVSHSTISNTLKAEPALQDEIDAARHQAQVQPLACIVRESRRSWKAATWLLKCLDGKLDASDQPAATPSPPPNREHSPAAPPAPGDDVESLARSLMQYLKG